MLYKSLLEYRHLKQLWVQLYVPLVVVSSISPTTHSLLLPIRNFGTDFSLITRINNAFIITIIFAIRWKRICFDEFLFHKARGAIKVIFRKTILTYNSKRRRRWKAIRRFFGIFSESSRIWYLDEKTG